MAEVMLAAVTETMVTLLTLIHGQGRYLLCTKGAAKIKKL